VPPRRLWKWTINFPAERQLPPDLVTRIVGLRFAELAAG
jgi:hypothetical protein